MGKSVITAAVIKLTDRKLQTTAVAGNNKDRAKAALAITRLSKGPDKIVSATFHLGLLS